MIFRRSIPEELSHIRELRYLNLSDNLIASCGSLSDLRVLSFLDLSNNRLTSLPERFLCGAHSIKHLNISRNQLLSVPQQLFSLSTLLDLNLSHNAIFELPDRICELVSIRNLNLSYNRLDEVPVKKLSSMIDLTSLNVRHNLIYLPTRFHHIVDARTILSFLLDESPRKVGNDSAPLSNLHLTPHYSVPGEDARNLQACTFPQT
jgi:Leucine-rich repeat (LRR) protein